MREKIQIFNTPEEVGVRILFILDIYQKKMSLQRLMYYDYFALHLHDLDQTLNSLHPDNPNHSSEIAIKKDLISNGLKMVISKGIISVKYTKSGIYYQSNSLTHNFISLFQNDYVDELKNSINIVHSFFSNQTDMQVYKYINKNIGKWAGEFESNTYVGGEYNA